MLFFSRILARSSSSVSYRSSAISKYLLAPRQPFSTNAPFSPMKRPSIYEGYSRDELIRILEARDRQPDGGTPPKKNNHRKKKSQKPFDFSLHAERRIALKFMYLGWDYDGLTEQASTTNTVERHLIEALQMTHLIRDKSSCEFHRCGRTDRGVSALSQVISLNVRSNLPTDHPIALAIEKSRRDFKENGPSMDYFSGEARECTEPYFSSSADFDDDEDELPYLRMLNSVLPDNICVYQWSPVEPSFSARFDARFRQYKYFFPRLDLDVEAMQKAASYFLGPHDFRNFCKFDPGKKLTSWDRIILEARIDPWNHLTAADADSSSSDSQRHNHSSVAPSQMMAFTVKGRAFLWHQVRSMMAILFLVGERKEKPEVVLRMLDATATPFKPMYDMAPEFPLVLWECGFREGSVTFRGEDRVHHGLGKMLIDSYWRHQMATACITGGFVTQVLQRGHGSLVYPKASGLTSETGSKYLPCMETDPVLEEHLHAKLQYTSLLKKEMSTNATLEERSEAYHRRKAERALQREVEHPPAKKEPRDSKGN